MNILILGSNGFIGNKLLTTIASSSLLGSISIVGIDKTQNKISEFIKNAKNVSLYCSDLTQSISYDILNKKRFDIIINSAASVGVDTVNNNPVESSENNLSITKNLYNYLLKTKEKDPLYNPLVIFFSSSEVYGNSDVSIVQNNIYNLYQNTNRGIYSITKLLEENYYNILKNNYNFKNIIIMRLFNIVGSTQSTDFIIKKIVSAIKINEELKISSNSYRRFCHIDFLTNFIIDIILKYCNNEVLSGTLNFGSLKDKNYISIKDLFYKIKIYYDLTYNKKYEKFSFVNSKKENIVKRNFSYLVSNSCTKNILDSINNTKKYDYSIDEIIKKICDEVQNGYYC